MAEIPGRHIGATARRVSLVVSAAALVPVLLTACGSSGPSGPVRQYASAGVVRSALAPHRATVPSEAGGRGVVGVLTSSGGPFLRDRYGRVVFLHGVNAVYKYAPFELYADPNKPWNFNAADAKAIASLGFNVVRLGILWQGLEPGHGGPNQPAVCRPGAPRPVSSVHMYNRSIADAYLARVARTVNLLGRYHVYTLLDMHQDVYSQPFRGEGAPEWAVCTDDLPIVPVAGRWSHNYSSPTLQIAVHHLWSNDVVGNLQGQLDLVWHTVAHYFRDNPWIAGYDPFNEPFSKETTLDDTLNFASDLECFYTGTLHVGSLIVSSEPVTCPVNDPREGVIPSIQSADPRHLVFVEPDIYGLRHGKPNLLGPMPFPGLVFNFHVYCGYRNPVTGDPTNLDACASQEFQSILHRQRERPQLASRHQQDGPGWFMSEFGASQSAPLLDMVTGYSDVFQLSWIYWAWKYYDDPTGSSGEPLATPSGAFSPIVSVLSRTYPQAVAGTPISQSFDPASGAFQFTYFASPGIHAPTVIYVPTVRHYPLGYCVTVSGGASITSPPGATELRIDNPSNPSEVDVTVNAGHCGRA